MADTRTDANPPYINSDEKTTMLTYLRYLRGSMLSKLDGLTEEQARTPGVESGTNLLWLLKHVNAVEINWVIWFHKGDEYPEWERLEPLNDKDTIASLSAMYRATWDRVDAVIEACEDLDALSVRSIEGSIPTSSMRWILFHLIEETARHAGHADIIRERLDGAVGR
jgi:uncharacterized damage-inducible protein DinB